MGWEYWIERCGVSVLGKVVLLVLGMIAAVLVWVSGAPAAGCDRSYPDFCVPPAPPNLACKDVAYVSFRVLPPDPHGFDRDGDGVGCEPRR